ncbi:MAG: hypothetical protein CMJ46_04175 [Planctomyces sp.]|nr:hypothetical protein [Planctomyces sp.]
MPIQFRCPQCKTRLSISRKRSGKEIKCPSCMAVVLVPNVGGEKKTTSSAAEESTTEDKPESSRSVKREPPPREEGAESTAPNGTTAGKSIAKNEILPTAVAVGPPPDEDEDEEEFSIRPMETDMEDMDLTPMVDVTFLLLIFFMISASFSLQKTMPFPPPERDEKGAVSMQKEEVLKENSVEVYIDENNVISIGKDFEVIQDPAMVAEKIAQYARQDNMNELFITSNPVALHDTVVWVLDSAAEAGMQRIRVKVEE